jgi:uncharacterized membrane protein YfcA
MLKGLGRATAIFLALAAAGLWLIPGISDYPLTRIMAAELVAFGLVVGVYGTMVGAGGGFLIVPVLLLVWHLPPALAAGTSLTVVFFNATAGSFSYAKQGRVDYKSGILLALPTLPGSVAGAFLAKYFSGRAFDLVFAVLLMLVAGLLLWKPVGQGEGGGDRPVTSNPAWWRMERSLTDKSGHQYHYQYNLMYGLVLSFFVGFLSSILGIGGGIIHVPALIHLLGFPSHLAAATSHFILAISSLVGAGTHVAIGDVLFGPAALMGIGVIYGAQIGARVAKQAKGAVTVRLLSIALIAVAIRLLMRT